MLVSFLSSNIPQYIEENSVLKKYAPVYQKLVFEKIKFKVLHYIQHDLFVNAQGSVKIRLECSKVLLLINYLMVT